MRLRGIARVNAPEGQVAFSVPLEYWDHLQAYFKRKDGKHRLYDVDIVKPTKVRSTGERSQNHHINGHIQQIAMETGNDFEDVKMYAKRRAITMGYPIAENENGEPIYSMMDGMVLGKSESEASVEEAGLLIEAIHQLAAELSIQLWDD